MNSSPRPRAVGLLKRPTLGRVRRILELLQAGTYPNCRSIAADLEISPKTAARDLTCMRDRIKLPIEYDSKRFGYYLTRPVSGFPLVPVTEQELFALCVAQKAVEQYRGTALQQPLQVALDKCMECLDDQTRFTLQNLDDVLSIRPFAPEDADARLFELVTEAIRERRALRFAYRKPGEKTAALRHVHPYHLMEFGGRWYLLAHDVNRTGSNAAPDGAIRKFVLGRVRDAEMTPERFEVPADFDPRAHFKSSLGVMTGGDDYRVVIEMDPWLTDVLRGRRWHPSQVVTELPGGASRLELRLGCLEEIQQHVLSWGARAHVVEPLALRERLLATAQELHQRYAAEPARTELKPASAALELAPTALELAA